jgi:ATPase subunit of ABC transporter with duplicated ATPase domains
MGSDASIIQSKGFVMSYDLIASVVVGIVVFIFQEIRKKKQRDKLIADFTQPIKLKKGERRNSILLVGLGGTGKTSLVNHMQRMSEKPAKTLRVDIYSISFARTKLTEKNQKNTKDVFHYFIADYKGQNLGQLIRHFILEQQTQNSPMRYGHVTSLILIVDLFYPNQPHDRMYDEPNEIRIYF